MKFEFATATRILFGVGVFQQIGSLANEMGKTAFVSCGYCGTTITALSEQLHAHGLRVVEFSIEGEPSVEVVQEGVQRALQAGCDFVIGIGGGSALDAGKAIAAMLRNEGDLYDYLEVIGKGMPLREPPAPYIAVPTTAGTGSEVTRNAVLGSPEHAVKVSLRSPLMLPRLALVDPELTYSLPAHVTAYTGMDALTQVLEPFVCNQPNPMIDAICREGMRLATRSLRAAYHNGEDASARQGMSLASLFGGLALANAKLGAVHGFAGPLGGMIPAPHGAICARLLPEVMAANVAALESREPEGVALKRYLEVAQILTGDRNAGLQDGIQWVRDLCRELHIENLSSYGLTEGHFPELVDKAPRASSMKGNPIKLTAGEMETILRNAL
jgi:alcohol dehydrogenase class IV